MTEDGDETVTLELERAEALVLYEWLSRRDEPGRRETATPLAAAVQRVCWDVECSLESSLTAVLASDYDERLAAAINEVCDEEPT